MTAAGMQQLPAAASSSPPLRHRRQHINQPFVVRVRSVVSSDCARPARRCELPIPRGVPTMASQMLHCGTSAELAAADGFRLELRRDGVCGHTLTLLRASPDSPDSPTVPVRSVVIDGAALREAVCHPHYSVEGLDVLAAHLISRALPAVEQHFGVENEYLKHALRTGRLDRDKPAHLAAWSPRDVCLHTLRHNTKAKEFLKRALGQAFDAPLALAALRLFARTVHTSPAFCVYRAGRDVSAPDEPTRNALSAAFGDAPAQLARGDACLFAWPGYIVTCVRADGCGAAGPDIDNTKTVLCCGLDTETGCTANGVVVLDAALDARALRAEVALGTLSLARQA